MSSAAFERRRVAGPPTSKPGGEAGQDKLQDLIGCSNAMEQVREQIRRVAPSPVPVLILGETGTGKELCAAAIASLSGRTPYLPVNCAAFAEGLIESELFGHERGAFTGAVRTHTGVIARSNGGVLFLDELAELPSHLQAKLLRALESGEYQPLGASGTFHSNFRIIAATSGDFHGRLRSDLLHRLGAIRVWLPPLRKRLEDIPVLADAFLRRYLQRAGRGPSSISPEAGVLLMQQEWPGNVRQLRNVVEASAAMAGSANEISMLDVLQVLPPNGRDAPPADGLPTLAEARARAERQAILGALQRSQGNRARAAKLLRISEATLYRKLGNGHSQG